MAEPFLGEIRMFAGAFAPQGWALCDGQILQNDQNTPLSELLGTLYGTGGTGTFALPDLRGRVPLGLGTGPGLSSYIIGVAAGAEEVTVGVGELPPHSHPAWGSDAADSASPAGGRFGVAASEHYAGDGGNPLNPMNAGVVGENSPGGQAHSNMAPFAVVNFIIALFGIFPPRS